MTCVHWYSSLASLPIIFSYQLPVLIDHKIALSTIEENVLKVNPFPKNYELLASKISNFARNDEILWTMVVKGRRILQTSNLERRYIFIPDTNSLILPFKT